MSRTAVYICRCAVLLLTTVRAGHGASYYVSATGNDDNDGLSEKNALGSLGYAVALASNRGEIKHIIVTGRLPSPIHFGWNDTGLREIVITGKAHAADHERAVLTYTTDGGSSAGISISGKSKIRFEHIEISGNPNASGLGVTEGAMVTLGPGAKITRNHSAEGGGVLVCRAGILIMEDGAEISHNRCSTSVYGLSEKEMPGYGGGISLSDGIVIIYGGRIAHNTVDGAGGGIFGGAGYLLRHGGVITKNTARAAASIRFTAPMKMWLHTWVRRAWGFREIRPMMWKLAGTQPHERQHRLFLASGPRRLPIRALQPGRKVNWGETGKVTLPRSFYVLPYGVAYSP